MRWRFGFLGLVPLLLLTFLVGAVAYNWGISAGQAQVLPPGAVVYPVQTVHTFGFGFGGFLLFLFIVVLLLKAFGARRWAGGPGGHGHGGWGGRDRGDGGDPNGPRSGAWTHDDVPPMFGPMLESWHRRAHGDATAGRTAGGSGPAGSVGANDHPTTGG